MTFIAVGTTDHPYKSPVLWLRRKTCLSMTWIWTMITWVAPAIIALLKIQMPILTLKLTSSLVVSSILISFFNFSLNCGIKDTISERTPVLPNANARALIAMKNSHLSRN